MAIHNQVRSLPGVCSGRPLIGGVPLFTIRGRFLTGESIASIADDFDISTHDVETALRYALEHDVEAAPWQRLKEEP